MNHEPIRVDRHEQEAGPRLLRVLFVTAFGYLCFAGGVFWSDCRNECCQQTPLESMTEKEAESVFPHNRVAPDNRVRPSK